MLNSTFILINGIGEKKEREFWKQGITSLEQLKSSLPEQYGLFPGFNGDPISLCKEAIAKGDVSFFANLLTPKDLFRIALTYPEEVLFLDIETTGLSLYYDKITVIGWSVGNQYEVYKAGENPEKLLNALKKAKVLVTFNGTMFDMKFIAQVFPEVIFPPAHIDLRFFSRRVGLSGGQKIIENEIGFSRGGNIKDVKGEAAPVLWHEYRRGNIKALKKLIKYNHADVEGMKAIFDYAVEKFCENEEIPEIVRGNVKFAKYKSKLKFAEDKNSEGIPINSYIGSIKPLITYKELNKLKDLKELTVIGIDLVSSEDRETGYCILKGDYAETLRLKTDQEMIDLALRCNADIVSIDSPLSIPEGRTSFFDDDPMRDEYGITRECERTLAKRGVKSYPCLIQSMQKLTRRGMELAHKFRKLGIPVIESYPGAAQDIMQIPRKQSGLEYLTNGMAEFGIKGDYTKTPVSHDELDAITSAMVGLFFWTGKFEALGNPSEGYLFIPDIETDPKIWLQRNVLGVCGHIAAGKTTAAKYLSELGFKETRYSMVLENILKEKGIEANRKTMQELGKEVNQTKGQRWLGEKVVERILDTDDGVVDGIRFLEDKAFLQEVYGPSFRLIYIDAPETVRIERMSDLKKENLKPEEAAKSLTESEITLLSKRAHKRIENAGALEQFYTKLKKIARSKP